MGFEEFVPERRGFGVESTPRVIINKKGKITFSSGLVKEYDEIKKSEYVRLYFDKENNAIGIKFLLKKEKDNDIKISRNTGGTYIYSRSFLNAYNILSDKTLEIEPRFDKKNSMFIFNLSNEKVEEKPKKRFMLKK